MLSAIPTAQFIGANIEILLLICIGIYLAWLRPSRIRREVDLGDITEAEGQAKLQKAKPLMGYMLLLAGVCQITVEIIQLSGIP